MASTLNTGTTLLSSADSVTVDSLLPSNIFSVEGLVAVITGGGTGIGLIMATALENNGATVYIVGRRLNVLEKAARENNKFDKIMPIAGDVSDRESLLAVVDVVKARHGYIDLLINNAGIARNLLPHPLPAPFDESPVALPPSPPASPNPSHPPSSSPSIQAFQNTLWDSGSPEDFAESFAVNVTAVYYTTVAFLDLLHQGNNRRRRLEFPMNHDSLMHPPYHTSQVLCVSSSGSFRLDSRVLSLSYTLAKCACTHLGKLLANLLTPWGIRSNVLAPGVWPTGTVSLWSLDGYIFTHSATQDMTTSPTPTFKLDPEVLAATVPLRRVGTQQDMAGTTLFLASRAGAYVNGAVWLVDGGRIGTVPSNY